MTQLDEAIARYHKLLEADYLTDLSWASELQAKMKEQHLTIGGRPISPVLRPHFVSNRQYANLVKAAEALYSAIDRIEKLALTNPAYMARMRMLPAEKMLASLNPGYSYMAVTSLLDTNLNNGSLHFSGYTADTPMGVIYGEALNNLFYDSEPVKAFRRKYKLSKMSGAKPFLQSLLKAYKEFGGKKKPQIAILEFRQPFQTSDSDEYFLIMELFRQEGFKVQIVSPDQLEYRDGVLRKGDFTIDLVYRRVKVSEFLVRFDLTHPLVRAYRDRTVCVVNSFRSELAQKRAIFDLLTDSNITASFPANERKAIREFIPWTRVVGANKTTYAEKTIDLPEFILSHRDKLVLRPNDDSGDLDTFQGANLDSSGWERAMKIASRGAYVVQEVLAPVKAMFPLHRYGGVEMQEMQIDVQPHSFLGRVNGCSTWLRPAVESKFSTITGLAPTFILEGK